MGTVKLSTKMVGIVNTMLVLLLVIHKTSAIVEPGYENYEISLGITGSSHKVRVPTLLVETFWE